MELKEIAAQLEADVKKYEAMEEIAASEKMRECYRGASEKLRAAHRIIESLRAFLRLESTDDGMSM